MSNKSTSAFPFLLVLWLLAMLGITVGVAALIWGLHGQGEKFWVNFYAVVAMEILVAVSWLIMGMRKQTRMIAFDFGFAGISGLYVLATLAISLIGLADILASTLLVLHLLAAAGFITLAFVFILARSATKSSWEALDNRRQSMEKMRAELRRITAKVPADSAADIQAELSQLANALKYATDETFPGGESEDAALADRLIEFNAAADGLPASAAAFHAAARRIKQAAEEREVVMKNLRAKI